MNRDDIIRMAQECGMYVTETRSTEVWWSDLAAFADLVAAAEREACAEIAEQYKIYGLTCADEIRARSKK